MLLEEVNSKQNTRCTTLDKDVRNNRKTLLLRQNILRTECPRRRRRRRRSRPRKEGKTPSAAAAATQKCAQVFGARDEAKSAASFLFLQEIKFSQISCENALKFWRPSTRNWTFHGNGATRRNWRSGGRAEPPKVRVERSINQDGEADATIFHSLLSHRIRFGFGLAILTRYRSALSDLLNMQTRQLCATISDRGSTGTT